MKTKTLTVSTLAAISCAVSCSSPARIQRMPVAAQRTGTSDLLSNQVFAAVNNYRHDRNKPGLRRDAGLDRLARGHAEFLLRNRGKHGPNGSDANHKGFGQRTQTARMTMGFGEVAENVVCCRGGNAATLVRLWSESRSHQRAMVSPYQYTGIGTVVDRDGMVFSVEMFGNMSNWTNSGNFQTGRF